MTRGAPIRAYAPLLLAALAIAPGCDSEPPGAPPAAPPVPDASVVLASPPATRPVARLGELAGQVQLERAGEKKVAANGDLFLKDVLETGPDGRAVVTFPGGRRLEIGPDARFVIGEDKTGLVVEVARGLVLSRVPAGAVNDAPDKEKKEAVALSILTPFGLTRVGAGGHEVAVDVRKDDARVDVKLGDVEFVSRNGESTRAGAGQALDVSVGRIQLSRLELTLEPIVVTLVAGGGKAEVKKSGSSRWRAAARGGEALTEGDAVRVREGRPQLSLAGSQTAVALERGTELVFGKSGRKGAVEESHLDVKRGGLTLALAAGRSRVVLGGLALENDGGGRFGVVKTKDGLEVSAVAGDLTLQQGDVSQRLQAGQVARLGSDGPPVIDEAERAEVMLPAKSGIKLYHPGLSQVSLGWSGQPGDYRVEVASDPGFTHMLAAGRVHRPQINVALPRRGALYWRAFTPDGKAEVDKGSVFIEPEVATVDLARLRNEVPDGAEKTTIFYQDKPPAVTFTWKGEPRAARYRVQVFRADSLARPVAERVSSQPIMPLEAGILFEGSYVWSVTPLSTAGEELRGGKMNKLELVYDNSVPNLVITSPRNGEAVVDGRVHATGVAPLGARLFINGKPTGLDGKSRFDANVAPIGRPPVLVFRLSRPTAADSYTVRVLRRGK